MSARRRNSRKVKFGDEGSVYGHARFCGAVACERGSKRS